MILSDVSLREALRTGRIGIGYGRTLNAELPDQQIQPASLDFTLSTSFKAFRNSGLLAHGIEEGPSEVVDITNFDAEEAMVGFEADVLELAPFDFCLGSTREYVRLPADLRGVLYGRSSLARLGLVVHTVAGNLDPGFEGQITLELLNVSTNVLRIPAGWRVAHVSFEELDRAAAMPYGRKTNSKYQGQVGATASNVSRDAQHQERDLVRKAAKR